MDFHVELAVDAATFLARTADLRAGQPLLTNVISTVAQAVADGVDGYEPAWFWLVTDDAGTVVGCASHTPPYRPVLSDLPVAAAALLADAIVALHPQVQGVNGPAGPAHAFAEAVAAQTGAGADVLSVRERIYLLHEHTPRPGVPGAARFATSADIPLLVRWFADFFAEVAPDVPALTAAALAQRLETRDMCIWEHEGEPVGMSGHAALAASAAGLMGRIGPVFVPVQHRGRGFGAAVTSAMIDHLQARGADVVLLYADADYEPSNRVYLGLGFRAVADVVELGQPSA